MIKVKAVREHQNLYGDKPKKTVGTEYEAPDNMVPVLVSAGLVEEVSAEAAVEPAKGGKGTK